MKRFVKDAIGYAAASGCALLFDMTILWLLVHFLLWGPVTSGTISFLAGSIVSYEISSKAVFKTHRLYDRRKEFLAFVAIGTLALAINAGVIFVAVNYLALHYMLAKTIAAAFTFSSNFIARRQLLFVQGSQINEDPYAH